VTQHLSLDRVRALLDQAAEDMAVVCGHLPGTVEKIREYQARGYPHSSGPGGGGRGGSTGTVPEREHSIPDAYAADHALAMDRLVRGASSLSELARLVHRYQPVGDVPTDDDDLWCTSCARLAHATPRASSRNALCSWCSSFVDAEDCLPPVTVLRRHLEGHRISEEEVRRALATQPQLTQAQTAKAKAKKRKKAS
jgi:hypothetical protein